MSVVELKIKIDNAVKTMRFAPETVVAKVIEQITSKSPDVTPDHALFLPAMEGRLHHPKWLAPERTLQFYDMQSDTILEYRKKHRQRKVKLLDDTIKTILLDESTSVQDCVEAIAEKIGIKNPEEFSLQKDGSEDWLNSIAILGEIGLGDEDILVYKKKFFFSDNNIDRTDPVQVHLLYIQCRDSIVEDKYPTTKEEAVDLAAIQAQITLGDHSPTRTPQPNLKEFLPPHWQKSKGIKKEIVNAYIKLAGMTDFNAKYRYIQLCRSLKTYGITTFTVKMRDPSKITRMKDVIFGVTRESCIIMDIDTKETQMTVKLTHIKRWSAADSSITFDFGDYATEYLVIHTPQCEQIGALINGYIEIILKARVDPGKLDQQERESLRVATEEKVVRGQTKGITVTAAGVLGKLVSPLFGAGNSGASHVPASQKVAITDIQSAAKATELLLSELTAADRVPRRPSAQTAAFASIDPDEYKSQLVMKASTVATLAKSILDDFNMPPSGGMQTLRPQLASKAQQLMSCLSVVGTNAQNASYVPDVMEKAQEIMEAAKKLAAAIAKLTKAAVSAADGNEEAKLELTKATFEAHAAGLAMATACDKSSPLVEAEKDPKAAKQNGKAKPVDPVKAARPTRPMPSPKSRGGNYSPKGSQSLRVSHSPRMSHSPRTIHSMRHSPRVAHTRSNSKSNLTKPPTPGSAASSSSSAPPAKPPTPVKPPTPSKAPAKPSPKDEVKKPETPIKPEKPEKPAKPEKVEKEKPVKPEKPAKPEKPEKEKPVKPEKPEKPEKVEKKKEAKPEKEKEAKPEKPAKPEKVEKEKPAKPEKVEKEKPAKPEKVEKPVEKKKEAKPEKEKEVKPDKAAEKAAEKEKAAAASTKSPLEGKVAMRAAFFSRKDDKAPVPADKAAEAKPAAKPAAKPFR